MTAVLENETRTVKKYDEQLLSQVKSYLETSGTDQTTLAKRVGKSSASISLYLKQKYEGNVEALENDLRKHLKLVAAKKKHKILRLSFEKTSVARDILKVAEVCQYNGELGLCYGASGLGKTTALEYLKKEGSGIILVDPDENATPRAILKQIADGLKIEVYDMLLEDFIANIIKRLKKSGYLIVVDEAENLKADVFRTLRKIHDRCEGTCGLLFIGTERLYGDLAKRKGEFDYVLNRVSFMYQLKHLNLEDVTLLVKQVFPKATEDIFKLFSKYTGNNARVLFNTLRRSMDIINNNNTELNEDVIREARGLLF